MCTRRELPVCALTSRSSPSFVVAKGTNDHPLHPHTSRQKPVSLGPPENLAEAVRQIFIWNGIGYRAAAPECTP